MELCRRSQSVWSKATLAGAVGIVAKAGLLAGFAFAGTGAVAGDILGRGAESALGGRQFTLNDPNTQKGLMTDFLLSGLTFGIGQRFHVDTLFRDSVSSNILEDLGQPPLDVYGRFGRFNMDNNLAQGLVGAWTTIAGNDIGNMLPQYF